MISSNCPFLKEKWKELSNCKSDWKWLTPNKNLEYKRLLTSEMSSIYLKILKEVRFSEIHIKRFNDRLVMSALRNGTISKGKYLTLGKKFYEKKLAYHLTFMYSNREEVYDMGNWFYFSYLSGYLTKEQFSKKIYWLKATSDLLTLNGVPYEPKDRK